MKDMQAKLTRLLDEANDCDLIGNLATDAGKRATFRRLAYECRAMAAQLRSDIAACAARDAGGEPPDGDGSSSLGRSI